MSINWNAYFQNLPSTYRQGPLDVIGQAAGAFGDVLKSRKDAALQQFQTLWSYYKDLPPAAQQAVWPRMKQAAQQAGIPLPDQYVDPQQQQRASQMLNFEMQALQNNPALRNNPQFMAQISQHYQQTFGQAPSMVPQTTETPGTPAIPGEKQGPIERGPGTPATPDTTTTTQVPFFAAGEALGNQTFGQYLQEHDPQMIQRLRASGADYLLNSPVSSLTDVRNDYIESQKLVAGGQKSARDRLIDQVRGAIVGHAADPDQGVSALQRIRDGAVQQGLITPDEFMAIVSDAQASVDQRTTYPMTMPDGRQVRVPGSTIVSYWEARQRAQEAAAQRTTEQNQAALRAANVRVAGLQQRVEDLDSQLQAQVAQIRNDPVLSKDPKIQAALRADPYGIGALSQVAILHPEIGALLKQWQAATGALSQAKGEQAELQRQSGDAAGGQPGLADGTPTPDGGTPPPVSHLQHLRDLARTNRGKFLGELKQDWNRPDATPAIRQKIVKEFNLTADEQKRLSGEGKPATPPAAPPAAPPAPPAPEAGSGASRRMAERPASPAPPEPDTSFESVARGARAEAGQQGAAAGTGLSRAAEAVGRAVTGPAAPGLTAARPMGAAADRAVENALKRARPADVPRVLARFWKYLSPEEQRTLQARYRLTDQQIQALSAR